MVRCDHVDKEQFYKHQESLLQAYFASNACNWDSSREVGLQATGATSSICHLEVEVSQEFTLGNDRWGRGMCEGSRKAQSLHFKSLSPDYFGK